MIKKIKRLLRKVKRLLGFTPKMLSGKGYLVDENGDKIRFDNITFDTDGLGGFDTEELRKSGWKNETVEMEITLGPSKDDETDKIGFKPEGRGEDESKD